MADHPFHGPDLEALAGLSGAAMTPPAAPPTGALYRYFSLRARKVQKIQRCVAIFFTKPLCGIPVTQKNLSWRRVPAVGALAESIANGGVNRHPFQSQTSL
jgi:hypothetical protein